MNEIRIRNAALHDAEELLQIYAHYVTNTAISFEYDVPSLGEFQSRIERISAKYPYLVAQQGDRIIGYAYAAPFVGRKAYEWSAELTIYLDHRMQKCGAGRMLYSALEESLKKMGITNLYACIGVPEQEDEYLTRNSLDFHEHMGFRQVGLFRFCGRKFGRWYHMVWAEKIIGEHSEERGDIISFRQLGRTAQKKENCYDKRCDT